MALHGWEELAERLSGLARQGLWAEMPALISDEILSTFAVVCDAADLPARLQERYQGLVARLALYLPFIPGERDEFWQALLKGIEDAGQ
jgi:hypothetical protein